MQEPSASSGSANNAWAANLAPAAMQAPAKPKKKRVRRQKVELDYLRDLVGKLELQLTRLRATPHEDGDKAVVKTEVRGPSIWKAIAERQQKERTRAEEKNQKLRVSLEGQLKLAAKLERLLQKRPREEEVAELTDMKRCKPSAHMAAKPTDEEIFADQLAHVERAPLDADKLFEGPEFADRAASFCNLQVMDDPGSDTGVAFVIKASSMLPFDVRVAEKAFWRAFAEDGMKKMSYFYDERLLTENLGVRSFGTKFNVGSFSSHIRGKETYRKYVGRDCVMIIWKAHTEPVQINDTKLSGVQSTQVGWTILRGVNLASDTSNVMMSTSLQSYCKVTLKLQDDIVDQELQVGALTNFVVNSHDAVADVCYKLINDVLVEEDWNINGWLENLAL